MFSFSIEHVLIDYLDSMLLIIQALELMFSSLLKPLRNYQKTNIVEIAIRK
jgi:hypothetical protein